MTHIYCSIHHSNHENLLPSGLVDHQIGEMVDIVACFVSNRPSEFRR